MTLVSIPSNPVPAGVTTFEVLVPNSKITLRCARWPALEGKPNRGTVCVFQGRTEFIEKYFETVNDLRARGFAVATLDWRGQGGSTRELTDRHKGYVEDFLQYEADVDAFMQQVVVLSDCPKPYFSLSHSTGGAILLRVAHSGKPWFEKLVFSAPMIDLVGDGGSSLARFLARSLRLVGFGKIYMPKADTHPNRTAKDLTSDQRRFQVSMDVVKKDPKLEIAGPTVAWLSAAFDTFDEFQDPAYAARITQPVLIVGAGNDHIVSTEAGKQFAKRLPKGSHRVIDGSEHEILQETNAVRAQFWDAFDKFI